MRVNPLCNIFLDAVWYVMAQELIKAYDMIAVIKLSRVRRKRVLAMRKRLMSFERIAEELGVTRQRAHAIYREALKAK